MTIVAILATVLGSLSALVAVLTYDPPPPPAPPPPTFAALVTSEVQLLRSDSDRADLFAFVKNPNANAGLREVAYTFAVQARGHVVEEFSGSTFFLPGQEKPVVLLSRQVPSDATEVTLRFAAPMWVSVAEDFRGPALVPVSREARVRTDPVPSYEVKGVVANESSLDFLRVEVTALGFDTAGGLVGVGKTFVGSLLSGERREYTLSWPLPPGRTVSEVRVVPEVNIFSPAAVQPRAGTSRLEVVTPVPSGAP